MTSEGYREHPPTEPQFRAFLTRLIRVPKHELDEREKARKRRHRGVPTDAKIEAD